MAEGAADSSILATVALPFAYIFAPVVGYVSWQLAAATITGFIAKENVVGTLAVCFGITNLIGGDELVLESGESVAQIAAAFGIGSGGSMLAASALAFLALNLFSPPCFAAIGAMNSEMRSKKWLFAGIGLQISVGYTVGFLINFFGTLISGEKFVNPWTVIVGWIVVLAISAVFAYLIIKRKREDRIKASLSESKGGEPV